MLQSTHKQLIALGAIFTDKKFQEIIIPNIWESNTFIEKAQSSEILKQMFYFNDKANRNICLNPEITAIIQELRKENYFQNKYPAKIFYISRCYRYEKPQAGRQREFTQLGVEIVCRNPIDAKEYKEEIINILKDFLNSQKINYTFCSSVKRGLTYYIENGFEVECNNLGAQKQIAGGGAYNEGVGFAIGLERLLLAKKLKN